jgi:hypothetical protein
MTQAESSKFQAVKSDAVMTKALLKLVNQCLNLGACALILGACDLML